VLPDYLSAILRALGFVALFQAAGVAMFLAIFHAGLADSTPAIRRLGRIAAIFGLAFVAAHFALEAGRMAGRLGGIFDPALQQRVLNSSMGAATALRCSGLLLLAIGLRGDGGPPRLLAITGANLAVFSFALIGHTAVNQARWLLAPLLLAHLSIVAFWFGALMPLHIVSRSESHASAAKIVGHFSRIAFWLVPGILFAGIAMACFLLPNFAALRDTYGTLLLAKLAGFVLLMALAAANKWRLGPAIERGEIPAIRMFRRVVSLEYTLIMVVLAVSAVMTSFFSPD
jgi:putative copper resistance protein D